MQRNNMFVIEFEGIDLLLIQEVTMPDVETNVLTYGNAAALPDIKIAGKRKVGDATLKKLRPTLFFDATARAWLNQTTLVNAIAYKRNLVIREVDAIGITKAEYIMEGCFPSKITHSGFKRGDDSELVMEEVTLSMDDFKQVF